MDMTDHVAPTGRNVLIMGGNFVQQVLGAKTSIQSMTCMTVVIPNCQPDGRNNSIQPFTAPLNLISTSALLMTPSQL